MKKLKTERFILVILILICLLAIAISGLDAEAKEMQVKYLKYQNDRQAAIIKDKNELLKCKDMLLHGQYKKMDELYKELEKSKPKKSYIGEYTLTAYCGCAKCCGKYALNRPNGIVTGAIGVELKEGVSVASPLPFGTKLIIDNDEYIVQDRTSEWVAKKYDDKIIDMYFNKHEDAEAFGKQISKVYKLEEVK